MDFKQILEMLRQKIKKKKADQSPGFTRQPSTDSGNNLVLPMEEGPTWELGCSAGAAENIAASFDSPTKSQDFKAERQN